MAYSESTHSMQRVPTQQSDIKTMTQSSAVEISGEPSLRAATADDADVLQGHCASLASYHNAAQDFHLTREALRQALAQGPCRALLALDDAGQVAGSAIFSLTFSTWSGQRNLFLEHLYVDPLYRGQGHGQALLKELRRLAGRGRVEWSVQASNVKSIQFYEAAGAHVHEGWLEMRMEGLYAGRSAAHV